MALAVAGWALLVFLHWGNDGLWFPQDAPRHLLNGLLVKDYAAAGLPSPRHYARSYLIRYPIICPTKYPPGFYLLEAATFASLGPSPGAAKGLVLGFALLATLYQVAWLRRFVDPGAGWLGAVLPLVPCIIAYSHAILLNVPAFALELAALYHARRWLDSGQRVQAGTASAFALAAILVYQGAFVLPLVAGTWLALTGRWRALLDRRVRVATAVFGFAAAGVVALWLASSPEQARWLVNVPYLAHLANWLWYPMRMTGAFGPFLLPGAASGAVAGMMGRRWRREVALSGGWIVVTYLFHSYIYGKDIRYLLPLTAPLLSLTAVAVWSARRAADGWLGARAARVWTIAAVAALLAGQVAPACTTALPEAGGFGSIVAAIRDAWRSDQGPDQGSILVDVDPLNSTLITCAVRLADADFRLRILPADWLTQLAGVARAEDLATFGTTEARGMEELLAHSGCRWILTQPEGSRPTALDPALSRRLRETMRGSRFQLVGTFEVRGPSPGTVELYRQDGPVGGLSELEGRDEARTRRMEWVLRAPVSRGPAPVSSGR